MNLTTRIDADPPNNRHRWCVVNEHDHMLLHFFGSKEECEAIDAEYNVGGLLAFGQGTYNEKGALFYANGVVHTRLSVEMTPCHECGDPVGRILRTNKGGGGIIQLLDEKGQPAYTNNEKGEKVPLLAPYGGCQIRL